MNYFGNINEYKGLIQRKGLKLGFNTVCISKAWFRKNKDNIYFEMYVKPIIDNKEEDREYLLSSLSYYGGNSSYYKAEFEIAKVLNLHNAEIKVVKENVTIYGKEQSVDRIFDFTNQIIKICLGKKYSKYNNKIYDNWEIQQVFRVADNKTANEIENKEEAKSYLTYENREKDGFLEKYVGCTRDEVLAYKASYSNNNASNAQVATKEEVKDSDMDF